MPDKKKRPNRRITQADIEAAKNLRRIWGQKKDKLNLTQERVGQDEFNSNQSLISQYLGGKIALGPVATMRFARVLQVDPRELRKDFDLMAWDDDLTPEARKIASKWMALPSRLREDVRKHIDNLLDVVTQKFDPRDDGDEPKRPRPN